MSSTVQFHRILSAPPERVFKAFLNPDAMAKWLPPHGFTGKVHSMDARVGGGYKMSFTNLTTGNSHSFGGKYVEMVENKKLKYTDKFEDPNMPGEMQVTVTFNKVMCGTELKIVQEGIP
ncbi:MAG: SRPBCC family protein, partial [Pseudobdellovibrionaceae bacterium]